MRRVISLFLVLLMSFSFIGAAAPSREQAPAQAGGGVLSGLKKNGSELSSASSLSMYDVVTFGRYPQGAYGEVQDIEWIVTGFDGNNRVKLMSLYALDTHRFHDTENIVSWTSTSLYLWLNSAFRANAFSQAELALVSGGVSIPSVEEAEMLPSQYLPCYSTAYAISQGADPVRNYWWLNNGAVKKEKTDTNNKKHYIAYASVVNEKGRIAKGSVQINFNGKGIRPTITVDLNPNAAQESASALILRNGRAVRSVYDLGINDTVTFGRYTQSPYASPAPIEWIVAGFDGGRVKLIAKYGLDSKRYNETHAMVTWTSSTLYSWLNNSFKSVAFNPAEQNLLVSGVTLPGVMEAESLPVQYRICLPTAYALANGVLTKQCFWWLSEPTLAKQYKGSKAKGWCGSAVTDDGKVVQAGYQINYDGKAVRPMVIVDLSRLP